MPLFLLLSFLAAPSSAQYSAAVDSSRNALATASTSFTILPLPSGFIPPRFSDVAAAVGINMTHHTDQHDCMNMMGTGVAWADYDGDGLLDLFVSDFNGGSHLFHNNGNLSFTDVTTSAFPTSLTNGALNLTHAAGVTWVDYDNDGRPDLLVVTDGDPYLFHNNGDGTFTAVFAKLKSLEGEWVGNEAGGVAVRVSYTPVAEGSALRETLYVGKMGEMTTLYYLNGNELMLTHYCVVGNQPRMRAGPLGSEIREITFTFLDATNLHDLLAAHMDRLVVTFEDANHFTQKWTMQKDGRDHFFVFHFRRASLSEVLALRFRPIVEVLHHPNKTPVSALGPIVSKAVVLVLLATGVLVLVGTVRRRLRPSSRSNNATG